MVHSRLTMQPTFPPPAPAAPRRVAAGILLALAAILMAAAACSPAEPEPTQVAKKLRPCPRYNNHMPASLQTPCREIDGKYYRADRSD